MTRGPARRRPPTPAALGVRLASHLRESELIRPGDSALVAVSGGLDSVALLHLLRFALTDWRLRLAAGHFDHAMRPSSRDDAAWVAGLCRAWEIPLESGIATARLRSEAEARTARYDFLEAAAQRAGCGTIATAHHRDDQAETVLFRAIRGTGLRGLGGIPPRRGRVVRPLLPFGRAEIEAYARAVGLRWREDPTNRELGYARNRLRHEVLPRLEGIAPGAGAALARLAEQARAVETAWEALVEEAARRVVTAESQVAAELARDRFLAYHPEIQGRIFRTLLRRHGRVPDRAGTRAALEFIRTAESGRELRVAGVRIGREFGRIVVRRSEGAEAELAERLAVIPAGGAGEADARIGGREWSVRWRGEAPANGGAAVELASDVLSFPLELRGWRPGDRIRLASGTKKLKKLFAEREVGRSARSRVPVLAAADGRVLWVVGLARAAWAAPSPGRPVLHITVTDAKHG